MGDNGFSNFKKADPSWFHLFCQDTFLQVFGNPNASAPVVAEHTSQPATESAATGASELRSNCDCCNERPWTHRGFAYGIETFFCCKCGGHDNCEE
jgi:hypothetical protein